MGKFTDDDLDLLMEEFAETTAYAGEVRPWREVAETGEDADDDDEIDEDEDEDEDEDDDNESKNLGDFEGHPFRGNQHSKGEGGNGGDTKDQAGRSKAATTDTGAGRGGGVAVSSPAKGRPDANPEAHHVANTYNETRGLPPVKHEYVEVDTVRAATIADAYDALPNDDRDNPAVREAYAALSDEIGQQWDHIVASGMTFTPWTKEGQPYRNSAEMAADVKNNKHMFFFTGGDPHPLLGEKDPKTGLSMNDKFRAVHDYFGHSAGGYGFGPRGEENAWISHSQMLSPQARRALTTETRGQNSWVNFGDQNYHADGTPKNIPPAERPYAKQKVALLPDEFVLMPGETSLGAKSLTYREKLVMALGDLPGHPFRGNQHGQGERGGTDARVREGRVTATMTALKDRYPIVAKNYARDSGTEMGSIEAHTQDVVREWSKQLSDEDLAEISGRFRSDVSRLLATAMPLHDIGKPDAIAAGTKRRQHEYTIPILRDVLRQEGFGGRDVLLATELLNHDLLGPLMKGTSRLTETQVAAKLVGKARKVGMPVKDFVTLQMAVYQADASAYPYVRQFMQREPSGKWTFAGTSKLAKVEALMKDRSARLLLGGPGSGNFGHAGRPGEVGGSAGGKDEKTKTSASRLEEEKTALTSDPTVREPPAKFALEEPAPPCLDSPCHPVATIQEEEITTLGGGINGTYVVKGTLVGKTVKTVYKPAREQRTDIASHVNDYDEVSVTAREAAAYDVDTALGLGITPQTDLSDLSIGEGSVQQWVDAPNAGRASLEEKQAVHPSQWYKLAVLDAVIGNGDRHPGNYLIKNGRVYAVDHGYAFPKSPTTTGSTARTPEESALPSRERKELIRRLRTTDWEKATQGRVKGKTLEGLKARAELVAAAIEKQQLGNLIGGSTYW